MSKLELYKNNKMAQVGATCVCPSCNTSFVKLSYQQVFCKSKSGTVCKDKYWNTVTPTKRCNLTRISPANARWKREQMHRQYMDGVHPFSSEGLGQWDD